MPRTSSELVEITKLNGEFRRNHGKLLGAFLHLRSISAVRGRSFFWSGLLFNLLLASATWLEKHGLFGHIELIDQTNSRCYGSDKRKVIRGQWVSNLLNPMAE